MKYTFIAHRATGLAVVSLCLLVIYPSTNQAAPQGVGNPMDALAIKAIYALSDADKNGVLVMDMTTSNGGWLTFGSWLADELSAALASQGKPTIVITDRSGLAESATKMQLTPRDELLAKNAKALGKALGAKTVVMGSYGAMGNDIGVTIAAFRVSEEGPPLMMVNARIPFSPQVRSHLDVTFDSLRPRDGIYVAGMGGVTIPSCLRCPPPPMSAPTVDLPRLLHDKPEGVDLELDLIVTADGHPVQISVRHRIGYGFDEEYIRGMGEWEFGPAVDADNKPVSVHFQMKVHTSFNEKPPTP